MDINEVGRCIVTNVTSGGYNNKEGMYLPIFFSLIDFPRLIKFPLSCR